MPEETEDGVKVTLADGKVFEGDYLLVAVGRGPNTSGMGYEEQGIEIKEATVSNSGEVAQAADSLGDVDAYYVPTDNTVV